MNYIPIIEKALDYVERHVSDDLLTSIAKGRMSLAVYSDTDMSLVLEKSNNLPSSSFFQITERGYLVDHLVHILPTAGNCGDLIRFFKDLIIYSRVCERVGYEQKRLNYSRRIVEDKEFSLKIIDPGHAFIHESFGSGKLFSFKDENDLLRKSVQYEKNHISVESILTMPEELKNLIIGVKP